MDRFVIHGGSALRGHVPVSGAKNAALPIMAACLLSSGESVIHGVPDLVDVRTLGTVLTTLGMRVEKGATGALSLRTIDETPCVAEYELVRRMRASICVLGPLLARRGRARVSLPGGCNIGIRPIDLHLSGLRQLGAEISLDQGYVVASARRLRGARIDLAGPHGPSVTGTCNVMSAAVLATGTSVIQHAACEPEVVDLGRFLVSQGARIGGLGTSTLEITGVDALTGGTHRVIPDRVEAGTLLMAGAITGGQVTVTGAIAADLDAVLEKMSAAGCRVTVAPDVPRDSGQLLCQIALEADEGLRATDCLAQPFTHFPTDLQAQFTSLMSLARGECVIADSVFPDRFMHVAELSRLGADIRKDVNGARVRGVANLRGAEVMASDLRASAALVMAALAARGTTVIHRIYHLDRGYEGLELKLRGLGASIERLTA